MNRPNDGAHAAIPLTDARFEAFRAYLKVAHNGNMDLERFLGSPYGEAFARRLQLRFRFEADAMGEAALAYYRSIGLNKELFDGDDYYERWALFTPLGAAEAAAAGRRFPLVFSHHGGGSSIETDEFSSGYTQIAGREGFMVAFLQNTNWQNTLRVLDIICERWPVDRERVYVSGFSQGAYQTHSLSLRAPERITAIAPCGSDIYRPWDNFDIPYTEAEHAHLRTVLLPFFQMTGTVEASSFVPLTDWRPRKQWPEIGQSETHVDPRKNDDLDPTRMHGSQGYRDPVRQRLGQGVSWGQCTPPAPPAGRDRHEWMMERVNRRLWLLDCEPRDAARCIGFAGTPADELHHVLGIYGDREAIREFAGCRHYTMEIDNRAGLPVFRYVSVENAPHWPYLMMGELAWDFFRQFRRDGHTGRIVLDRYTGRSGPATEKAPPAD